MSPARRELRRSLAAALGLLDRPQLQVCGAEPADDALLTLAHQGGYLAMVRQADRLGPRARELIGLAGADTPVVPDLHDLAAGVVGASARAARLLAADTVRHAVCLDGGLHHAMPGAASGFCVYNDVVVALHVLLQAGLSRIAYVDLDAHHGDGVEAAFAADPRVLTVSLHQDGRTLFPWSGAATDVGPAPGHGSVANLALPPHTADAGWLRAFSALVPVLVRAHQPQVLVVQAGCDGHRQDPLTDLQLTAEGFLLAVGQLHELAHEQCAGRLLVLGGGGYSAADAVPRVWAQVLATLTGPLLPWDTELPEDWRVRAAALTGVAIAEVPRRLGDGAQPHYRRWDAGEGDPDDPLDRAVAATRRAVLPLLGLDPLADR